LTVNHRARRYLAAVLAGLLAATLLYSAPAAASRSTEWSSRAEAAIADFAAIDAANPVNNVNAYAYMAAAIARLHGWSDPRVADYLNDVYALVNPDGGYGLNFAYDALANGTTNPADTSYLITVADHVGQPLIEGYKAGVVPYAKVKSLVDLVMAWPQINYNTAYGKCLAYSRHANDNVVYGCVHNADVAAARFLYDASNAGVGATGLNKLVVDITRRETFAYIPGPITVYGVSYTAWWRFMDTTSMSDTDHNSYIAYALYPLVVPITAEVAVNHMNNALADNSMAPVAHLRLTGLPARPGAMHPTEPTTWWCVLGDQWLPELDAYTAAAVTAGDGRRLAQVAYYAAANSLAC